VTIEWDPIQARRNRRKHPVASEEAATALGDPLALTYPDPNLFASEVRCIVVGMSTATRSLVVAPFDGDENFRNQEKE
jgi:uncharacterized DUF497 family protein